MAPNDIIDDLCALLQNERDEGITSVEVAAETLAGLAAPAPALTPSTPLPSAPTEHPIEQAPTNPSTGNDSLERIARDIAECTRCELCRNRTNTVPGVGNPRPDILFIGEAPGADEDREGIPFVGRAGKLLTKMIEAMGYTRDDIFIANINKCRPPGNRTPTPDEMKTCIPFLKRQIALLQPRVIVAMGATAVSGLVDVPEEEGITKLRGNWMSFEGIDLMPTFHPAYLLRSTSAKRPVWNDLKAVLQRLGRPIPAVKKK